MKVKLPSLKIPDGHQVELFTITNDSVNRFSYVYVESCVRWDHYRDGKFECSYDSNYFEGMDFSDDVLFSTEEKARLALVAVLKIKVDNAERELGRLYAKLKEAERWNRGQRQ